ncbi:MAG: hypothetical protein V1762_03090 [Nitrospirota bacterium]
MLEGSIIKRLSIGKDYGVAILAEGIANKFDPEELLRHECVEKDEAGRVRLSEKPKMRYVDITSEPYLIGREYIREYMMRLEKEDFKTENIKK